MKKFSASCLALLASVATTAAAADDQVKPRQCFSMPQFENWKAPDNRTIYIRVNLSQYYRLDLSAPCSLLTQAGTHLVTKTRGSDQVCSGVDWELSVSDATTLGGGGIRQACIVKTQTPLSVAEVAAIPKKFKP